MHDDKLLWKFVDGELPPAETGDLEKAALSDPGLAARIDEMRECKRAVNEGAPMPGPGFAGRVVVAAAAGAGPIVDLEEARRFLRWSLVAAALLAAVGLVFLTVRFVPGFQPVPTIQADPLLGR